MKNIWEKSSKGAMDWVVRFSVGDDAIWDTVLLPYDIAGTRAHSHALQSIGIINDVEAAKIDKTLDELLVLVKSGALEVTVEDEDMHTVIERFVTEKLGATGEKIHTGRSRNDQVLVALRLYLRFVLRNTGRLVEELVEACIVLAEANAKVPMPGYTHQQPAMPSTVGLWAMGYAELLASDLAGIHFAAQQADVCPWGSAAGYGIPHLDLPREAVARELGFGALQTHVTSVQLSRGKMEATVVHALVQVASTINRMASDVLLFTMAEFGFVQLPDVYCTGSSIMPQKKNPDLVEISRGLFHKLSSHLQFLLGLPANLTSGYHRDLQLTKAAVMESCHISVDLLTAWIQLVPQLEFREEALYEKLHPALFATGAVYQKVVDGIPFRRAYREVAAELDSVQKPAPEHVHLAYVTAGTPGSLQPEAVRAKMEPYKKWLTNAG